MHHTIRTTIVATIFGLVGLFIGACAVAPMPGWHISHAVASPYGDGKQYHSCAYGPPCPEGYGCTRFGCEWCGPDTDGPNRCTEGNDGDMPGYEPGDLSR